MFQVRVRATDQGNPPQSEDMTVNVRIQRNNFHPQFTSQNYYKTISDKYIPGVTIIQITAEDNDPPVNSFHLLYNYCFKPYSNT